MTDLKITKVLSDSGTQWISASWKLYKRDPISFSGIWILGFLVNMGLSQLGTLGMICGTLFGFLFGLIYIFFIRKMDISALQPEPPPVKFLECIDEAYKALGPFAIYSFLVLCLMIAAVMVGLIVSLPFGIGGFIQMFQDGSFEISKFFIPIVLTSTIVTVVALTVQIFTVIGKFAVIFRQLPALDAIKISFRATYANLRPLIVYYTVFPLVMIIASLFTLGLALVVLIPMLAIGEYLIWRDALGLQQLEIVS